MKLLRPGRFALPINRESSNLNSAHKVPTLRAPGLPIQL
jgi:hypothetical protein